MSDIFENVPGKRNEGGNQICRVAYTLNNSQPVSSTIIGDQPLFYMDYIPEDEDDGFFDAAELNILEGELETLKNEIDTFDRFSEEFIHDTDKLFQDFLADKDFISGQITRDVEDTPDKLKATLAQSRMAEAYMEFAAEHDVEIMMSSQVEDASYNRNDGYILINPNLDFADQLLLATRELRRHWQHRQGALINPLMFHPDNAVLVNRAQVADLAVAMVRIAWELQLTGDKACWERIENSAMADLGRAFAREAFMDFRTLNNGQASAAVFESWFLSERCRAEDKKLVKQMLADYQGYVFGLEEAEQSITPALICALGTMPYGKNYLATHAPTIMEDAIFTDVRDRSNANFLWFIKFERSFRETEQELQTDFEHAADGVRRTASQEGNQEESSGDEQTAEIITLYSGASEDSPAEKAGDKRGKGKNLLSAKDVGKSEGQGSADIVYLRRWSAE